MFLQHLTQCQINVCGLVGEWKNGQKKGEKKEVAKGEEKKSEEKERDFLWR